MPSTEMRKLLSIFASLLVVASPALAIDPGTVQGWVQIDGGAVTRLTQAYVYLERPSAMRIVLADREVPLNALPRIAVSAVTALARDGKVRGLLIQVDPGNPARATVTPLDATAPKGKRGAMRELAIANNRVKGEIKSHPADVFELAYDAKFSAPLFSSTR